MICHHCGEMYIELFPNAKRENLFIGMIHAFRKMYVPSRIMTDNMKSVVIGRDIDGKPLWQKDYEQFMNPLNFQTTLCKPRPPYTKGKVERLVRFVKDNFLPGRVFTDFTDLKYELVRYDVTWSRQDTFCEGQFFDDDPEENHTMPVKAAIHQEEKPSHDQWFDQFSLEGGGWHD